MTFKSAQNVAETYNLDQNNQTNVVRYFAHSPDILRQAYYWSLFQHRLRSNSKNATSEKVV